MVDLLLFDVVCVALYRMPMMGRLMQFAGVRRVVCSLLGEQIGN